MTAIDKRTLALVIAAREFWDVHNDLSEESRALDKALEPFSASVPYANEPAPDPAGEGEPFGYWVEQKHAEPALLRNPAYIPEPGELRTVTPLYKGQPA